MTMARWKPPTTANGKRVRLLIPLSNPPPGPIQGIHVLSQIRNQSGTGAASHLGFARARNKSRRGGAAAVWSSWLPWRICWLPHLLNAGPLMDHVFDTQQLALNRVFRNMEAGCRVSILDLVIIMTLGTSSFPAILLSLSTLYSYSFSPSSPFCRFPALVLPSLPLFSFSFLAKSQRANTIIQPCLSFHEIISIALLSRLAQHRLYLTLFGFRLAF